jgi:WD40 repeat protein
VNDLPRQKLCQIIAQYGPALTDDARRTEALLRDFCGEYKREIFVLVSALRGQVAADLLTSQTSVPREVLLAQLTRRLQENLALAEDAARWAVESWALALGVIAQPPPSLSPQKKVKPAPAVARAPQKSPTDERLLCTLTGHTGWVHCVAFHPHGQWLASGSQDGTVRLWDVSSALSAGAASGQGARWPLQSTSPVHSVAFSWDGRILAWGGGDGVIQLRDVARSQKLHQLAGRAGGVNSVALSPDGQLLASASSNVVTLWDVIHGRELRQLQGHTDIVQSVAFSPAGQLLASAGGDGTVRLWDVAGGKAVQVRRLEGHKEAVWGVAFSPDGGILASGSYDATVWLWDVARGQGVRQLKGHMGGVNSVAFSPDGQTLASASSDTIVLCDVSRGRKIEQLRGHAHLVQSVAFSPDGRVLASGSWDETVRLWRFK